ncbi:MAG: hypothetical protein ACP5HQ_06260 [Thermoprotei archaeon]
MTTSSASAPDFRAKRARIPSVKVAGLPGHFPSSIFPASEESTSADMPATSPRAVER